MKDQEGSFKERCVVTKCRQYVKKKERNVGIVLTLTKVNHSTGVKMLIKIM